MMKNIIRVMVYSVPMTRNVVRNMHIRVHNVPVSRYYQCVWLQQWVIVRVWRSLLW